MSRQPNSVQRETYIRANYNKKKVKEADFPAEAPESNSHKYEAGNAEHSLHVLSSECSKECSLTEFNESCDRAKNYGGTKQAEKHRAHEVFSKYLSFSRDALQRQQALCPNREILTDRLVNIDLLLGYNLTE
jgi:hypothetical protein